jgi:hypothetical protein
MIVVPSVQQQVAEAISRKLVRSNGNSKPSLIEKLLCQGKPQVQIADYKSDINISNSSNPFTSFARWLIDTTKANTGILTGDLLITNSESEGKISIKNLNLQVVTAILERQSLAELISLYEAEIAGIIEKVSAMEHNEKWKAIEKGDSFEHAGLGYRIEFSNGKHQDVHGLIIKFPDGQEHKIVARQLTRRDFSVDYATEPSIQTHFPRIFASVNIPDEGGHDRNFMIVERIEGEVERLSDSDDNGFKELIKDPDKFSQLIDDLYEQLRTYLNLGFSISDLAPVAGHNIAYNSKEDKFQIFDPDVFKITEEDKSLKVLMSLKYLTPFPDEKNNELQFELLKRFIADSPDECFSSTKIEIVNHVQIKNDAEVVWLERNGASVLYFDPEEDRQYRDDRGTSYWNPFLDASPPAPRLEEADIKTKYAGTYSLIRDQENLSNCSEPIVIGPFETTSRTYIPDSILGACKENDFDKFQRAMEDNNDQLVNFESSYSSPTYGIVPKYFHALGQSSTGLAQANHNFLPEINDGEIIRIGQIDDKKRAYLLCDFSNLLDIKLLDGKKNMYRYLNPEKLETHAEETAERNAHFVKRFGISNKTFTAMTLSASGVQSMLGAKTIDAQESFRSAIDMGSNSDIVKRLSESQRQVSSAEMAALGKHLLDKIGIVSIFVNGSKTSNGETTPYSYLIFPNENMVFDIVRTNFDIAPPEFYLYSYDQTLDSRNIASGAVCSRLGYPEDINEDVIFQG